MKYSIYSHFDSDGGISAAILGNFIKSTYGKHGWDVDIAPVNYGGGKADWTLREITWPCAILDFALHPRLLDARFFVPQDSTQERLGTKNVPCCYWVDHHPTGSSYPFLTAENVQELMPNVISVWDTTATSTPGLMRTHYEKLKLPKELILQYEYLIDLGEIIDGALYATAEAAHDFSSHAVRLQTLFNPSHPLVDRQGIYKQVARTLMGNPEVEFLFDSDPMFSALIEYERTLHVKRTRSYEKVTERRGSVALANFSNSDAFEGMGRFLPFLLYPDIEYAVHVTPTNRGTCTVSCGINPWNKPQNSDKHLGNYFAKHFEGGGHSFVAGGKVPSEKLKSIDELCDYLNS